MKTHRGRKWAPALLLVAACTSPRDRKEPRPAPSARASVPAEATDDPLDAGGGALRKAIALGDFAEAERLFSLMSQAEAALPETRYARARVLLASKEYGQAVSIFTEVRTSMPEMSADIDRRLAECALATGPYDQARAYFEARGDAASLVDAALAAERAGNLPRARSLLDRALGALEKSEDAEADALARKARTARARVAKAAHDDRSAAADWRFLAVNAAATPEGHAAMTALSSESSWPALTTDERLSRARSLAETGALDDALAELDTVEKKGALAAPLLLHARAQAHYLSRISYKTAAELYESAARAGGRDAPRDAFHAARSLARADDEVHAIERYEAMASRYPTSEFTEEARYQAARLRFLIGRYAEAATGYEKYLAAYGARGGGRFRAAARYELALAHLVDNHGDVAAKELHGIAAATDDPLDRAAIQELEAVALAASGDRDRAAQLFASIIRDRPLSLPAMTSVARLLDMGLPVPPRSRDAGTGASTPMAVDLPPDVRLLSRLGFGADAEHALSDHEGEILAKYAPRSYEALCAAYARVGAGAARYKVGRGAVKKETFDKLPTDETRWAWECTYPRPYPDLIEDREDREGLPTGLLYSVMRQESGFRPTATSPAFAVGLLQLIPRTASRLALEMELPETPDLRSPPENVRLGARYLHRLVDRFAGSLVLALASYNAGPRAVCHWLEEAETLPTDLFVARIPFAETRGYVARVLGNLARYAVLYSGDADVPKIGLALPRGIRKADDDY